MIRWQLVRAFERGARRNHIPNIELQRYICEVFHVMEDSIYIRSPSTLILLRPILLFGRFRNGGQLRVHALSFGFSPSLQEPRRFRGFSSAPEKAHLCHLRSYSLCPMPYRWELFSSSETAVSMGAFGNNRRSAASPVSEARLLNVDNLWSRCIPDTYDWHNDTKQTRPTFDSPELHRLPS